MNPRSTRTRTGAAALAVAVLAVAGCGGASRHSAATTPSPKAPSAPNATIGVANTGLGTILVDSQGRTLYLFKKDLGPKSTCFGECARDWPPLRAAGKLTVGTGANAALLATAARPDGMREITYHDHPVYLFAGDKKPGDTNGQGLNAFGGEWLAVSPAGNEVSGRSATSGGNGVY
jgi:predicted lipoprotein with Yx(FWY)xxD motif